MSKWEVEKDKRFLLDKNGSYEGVRSNTRKTFVKPVGMNILSLYIYSYIKLIALKYSFLISIELIVIHLTAPLLIFT